MKIGIFFCLYQKFFLFSLRRVTFLLCGRKVTKRAHQRGKIPNLFPLWNPLIQTAKENGFVPF